MTDKTNDDLAIEYYTARKAGKKVRAEWKCNGRWIFDFTPNFTSNFEYRLIYETEPVQMMQLAITEYPAPYRGQMKLGQKYWTINESKNISVIELFWDDHVCDQNWRDGYPGIWLQREHAQAYLDCITSGKEKRG